MAEASLIEIDPATPDMLRPFIVPLEDLFREWGHLLSRAGAA
jgi:hypothetical protein